MPTPQNLHHDPLLSEFAARYTNSQFIADVVCPVMPVDVISAAFKKGSRADDNEINSDFVGATGVPNEIDNIFTEDTYSLRGAALMQTVPSTSEMANTFLSPEEDAVANVMQRIMLAHEYRVASILFNASNFAAANTYAGTDWTNTSTGTPLTDIQRAAEKLPSNGDDSIMVAALSDVAFNALCRHPQILSIKGTAAGMATQAELESWFGIKFAVSKVTSNTANKGQTASYSRIWTTTKFGLYSVPRSFNSLRATMFAASFRRREGFQVTKWNDPRIGPDGNSTMVKVGHRTHAAKIIHNDQGVLLTGITS